MIWRDFSNSVIKRNIPRRMVACLASKGRGKAPKFFNKRQQSGRWGGSSLLPNIKKSWEFDQMKKKIIGKDLKTQVVIYLLLIQIKMLIFCHNLLNQNLSH